MTAQMGKDGKMVRTVEMMEYEEAKDLRAELLKEQLMKYRLAYGWHVGSDKDEAVYNFLIEQLIEL